MHNKHLYNIMVHPTSMSKTKIKTAVNHNALPNFSFFSKVSVIILSLNASLFTHTGNVDKWEHDSVCEWVIGVYRKGKWDKEDKNVTEGESGWFMYVCVLVKKCVYWL